MLSLDDILKADDFPVQRVDVPEWGGFVYVRSMSADERDRMEELWRSEKTGQGLAGLRAFIVCYCLCDESGRRIVDDVAAAAGKLGKRNAAGVTRVFEAIAKLNGLTKEDEEALEKNS